MVKRLIATAGLIFILCQGLFGQTPDLELILSKDFESVKMDESLPDSLTKFERVSSIINRQLSGQCNYDPECNFFLSDAIDTFGVVPALVITSDRLTRSGKIGSAGAGSRRESDGKIHEGVDAYRLHPAGRVENASNFFPEIKIGGQTPKRHAGQDFEFVSYLIDNDFQKDAAFFVESQNYFPSDTLDFLLGWTAYNQKQLEKSSYYFSKVGKDSPLYDKSLFYNVVSNAHLGNYTTGDKLLDSYSGTHEELKYLQKAGLGLLSGDNKAYLAAASHFSYENYAISESERILADIYNDRITSTGKNPLVAAIASAVIPGSGKIYAGQLGEGIASFLVVGSIEAITAESWCRNGFANFKTILFSALSAAFYIGNIYGSYISVSIQNNNLIDAQNTAILYNIHIPLRTVFK